MAATALRLEKDHWRTYCICAQLERAVRGAVAGADGTKGTIVHSTAGLARGGAGSARFPTFASVAGPNTQMQNRDGSGVVNRAARLFLRSALRIRDKHWVDVVCQRSRDAGWGVVKSRGICATPSRRGVSPGTPLLTSCSWWRRRAESGSCFCTCVAKPREQDGKQQAGTHGNHCAARDTHT